jgi:hypothetical protein
MGSRDDARRYKMRRPLTDAEECILAKARAGDITVVIPWEPGCIQARWTAHDDVKVDHDIIRLLIMRGLLETPPAEKCAAKQQTIMRLRAKPAVK